MFHVKHSEKEVSISMDISSSKLKLITEYMESILKVNENINLTRISDDESAKLLHIEDSLSILPEISNAPDGKYIDLGSGGGFPGVPIGIASERETVLIDSVKKKMNAVDEILKELGISNIHTVGDRIEIYSTEHTNEFSVISARAVTSIPALLELASPLMRKGAHLILMKSHAQEPYDKLKTEEILGLKEISFREYNLSDDQTYRCIYVFEKIKDHDQKIPRRIGMAQKRPLVKI